MRHWTAAVTLSVLALHAQSQPVTINGRVVADETGEPVRNARVGVTPVASGPSVSITDGDGRFTFAVLSGNVTISASKTGYAKTDVTRPAGADAIEIRLRRGAAISGRVVDDFGDSVVGARVAALAIADAPKLNAVMATADTDDLGEYRLAGLAAGTFAVRITTAGAATTETAADGQIRAMPSMHVSFYPGVTTQAEAEPLRVQSGEDRNAIDFVIPADHWSGQQFGAIFIAFPRTIDPNPTGPATGVIRGRVASTDGRSVPRAQLRLAVQGDPRQSQTALADRDGRFEFTSLPPGTFRIIANKAGYESTLENPPKIEVREGETRERVDVTLTPWGSLAGRVFDEDGDPMQGASVRVLQVRYQAGRRRLVPAASAPRLTDDLGRYRLHDLPPGAYIVSASVGDVASADLPGYTRAYYPGTTMPSAAQFVSVGAGQVVTGIDVSLSRARTARVAGKMIGADGQQTMGGRLELVPRSSSVVTVPAGARILPDGRFEFTNVTPGQYTVRAQRNQNNPWSEGEFGLLPVSVDGADVTGLMLQMSAGSTIRGRVTFDAPDPSNTPDASQVEVTPAPSDFDLAPDRAATARANADKTFELLGISGPRRLQLLRAPAGWALKEILVRGIDVTDRVLPFGRAEQSLNDVEVVLTDRVSELSGAVNDDRGQPAPGAHVIVFGTGRDRWYPGSRFMRTAVAAAAGAFSITGLPFSTYYVAAVAKLPPYGDDAWQDPDFLDTLARSASTVTIREGEKRALTLTTPGEK
jgi:protocatechuate 3,4-dioxygenase beta subunit